MNEQGMFRAIALLAAIPQTERNELTVVLIRTCKLNWVKFCETILNWICNLTPHHIPDEKASTTSKADNPSTQATNPGLPDCDFCWRGSRTVPLLLPNSWGVDWLIQAWSELNWMKTIGPHAPNWTEHSFQTNWWPVNWSVLNWCLTILNMEQEYCVSSQTLPALRHTTVVMV